MNPYLGEIRLLAFNFAPRGWHMCDGSLVAISQNAALFSLLGTQYGGDGQRTFALPDLRGRVPIHFGPTFSQGEQYGVENVGLVLSEMPAHNHTFSGTKATGLLPAPTGGMLAQSSPTTSFHYATDAAVTPLNPTSVGLMTGGGVPHANMQPYLVMTYCIAVLGTFPSRN